MLCWQLEANAQQSAYVLSSAKEKTQDTVFVGVISVKLRGSTSRTLPPCKHQQLSRETPATSVRETLLPEEFAPALEREASGGI